MRGFTLVAIVALLAPFAGPHIFESHRAAELRRTRAKCREYHDAVMMWRLLRGSAEWPASLEAVGDPLRLRVEPDAWGRPFRMSHDGRELRIWSDGPDGKPGTSDDLCYVPVD